MSTLVSHLRLLRSQYNTLQKQLKRIKAKMAESTQACGIVLDERSQEDMSEIISSPGCKTVFENLPKDSFQSIFWQQQMEALAKNPKVMRWHPIIIRWCLYLRHR